MKVLLLIDYLGQGGAERQMSYLAIGLKKRGHDVKLINFYANEIAYQADLNKAGINVEILYKAKSPILRPFYLVRYIKQFRPDIVIAYKDGTCMSACIARILTSFKLIVSERNTTQKISKKDILKFLLYRKASKIVPNSFSQTKFLRNNYPNLSDKLVTITNVVDIDKFSPAFDHPETPNKIVQIITTARVAPQKNVEGYLHAIRILKDRGIRCHFNWWGRLEYQNYFDNITNLINQLGIDEMVTFHGGSTEIETKYRDADIFLLPSIYEGFSNVLCEAMSSGLPAIASGVCDNPVILGNDNWIFDPLNYTEMADKIERMVNMSDMERKKIGNNNRIRIINMCSEEKFISSYINL